MATREVGPCECCGGGGGGISYCELCDGLPNDMTITVDATSLLCTNLAGKTGTLTYGLVQAPSTYGWKGSIVGDDTEEACFILHCYDFGAGNTWALTSGCQADVGTCDSMTPGGGSGRTEVEAGWTCDPLELVFLSVPFSGGCCGGLAGTIDVTITV